MKLLKEKDFSNTCNGLIKMLLKKCILINRFTKLYRKNIYYFTIKYNINVNKKFVLFLKLT